MARVTVTEPFQVVWANTIHGPGETAVVPDEVAAEWIGNGWATAQPTRPPATKADRIKLDNIQLEPPHN